MKLSIIIPAYNAENVLEHCLNSLIYSLRNASDDEAEIICVNDGSTDNTREILQRYMAEDARIRIFHKKNGGVSSARNFGLSKVTGDYVAWVDADDYVTSDWYEEIRTRLADEPDCIVFDYFGRQKGKIEIAISDCPK
jgi:glycosyltransferase involved in cell wall biosynthesis